MKVYKPVIKCSDQNTNTCEWFIVPNIHHYLLELGEFGCLVAIHPKYSIKPNTVHKIQLSPQHFRAGAFFIYDAPEKAIGQIKHCKNISIDGKFYRACVLTLEAPEIWYSPAHDHLITISLTTPKEMVEAH